MYANGPDWWIDQFADTGLTEDRWIKAMEIKPGNPKIVHHVVIYAIEPDAPTGPPEARRAAARVRGRQVRRHLRRQHRPAAEDRARGCASTCTTSPSARKPTTTTIGFMFYPKG